MTKHIMDMTIQELQQITCFGYESVECNNNMAEHGCRNSMKDNEAFCSDCCAEVNKGDCC